jgi:hypothetical protein
MKKEYVNLVEETNAMEKGYQEFLESVEREDLDEGILDSLKGAGKKIYDTIFKLPVEGFKKAIQSLDDMVDDFERYIDGEDLSKAERKELGNRLKSYFGNAGIGAIKVFPPVLFLTLIRKVIEKKDFVGALKSTVGSGIKHIERGMRGGLGVGRHPNDKERHSQ